MYCCALWSDYCKATYRKLTVALNNFYRRLLGLPWRCSASAMHANHDLPNLDTVIININDFSRAYEKLFSILYEDDTSVFFIEDISMIS